MADDAFETKSAREHRQARAAAFWQRTIDEGRAQRAQAERQVTQQAEQRSQASLPLPERREQRPEQLHRPPRQ